MRPERARFDGEGLRHVGVPYDSDESFLDLTVPRVRAALNEGRRVLVITGAAKLARLAEALGDDAGRIDSRVSAAWYGHPYRTLAACHEYTRGRRTLVIGEPSWEGRSEREIRELIRAESVVNAALSPASAVMLCMYDLRAVPPAVLAYNEVNHPLVLGADGEAASTRFVPPHKLMLNNDHAPLPEPGPGAVTIRFTGRELRRLRQSVGEYARAAGMDRNQITSLVISVSEIAANSIEHGAGYGTITTWAGDGELICEIADPGGALDDPLPGYIPPEPESPRGYGLWISRQLCDLVELRTEGGVLRVRLHLSMHS
ncbi:anti-sigma regulatory factor (Ser/Thr protein kinase) [Nonomuraea polychroma]|uniref:Anti-sigma regulatory factor (Ser/Thr protein kinase) n=1 Tax=Nonomuraea polychroma TaxID=46176 RepID=A0A438MEI7_9ACTN|nr:sensor histidine kinase [Nonomuraea polychroma]RVX44210.1 anti-sigma regulatory factor (Ser/Thr protein kinase) [Nonomuraea polychroma]